MENLRRDTDVRPAVCSIRFAHRRREGAPPREWGTLRDGRPAVVTPRARSRPPQDTPIHPRTSGGRRIDASLRALAARLARDRTIAATVIDHPELAPSAFELSAGDRAVLAVLADAVAAYRLAHPQVTVPSLRAHRPARARPAS